MHIVKMQISIPEILLPVETPVLVDKVDGETHEGVASGRRPHVRGEGSAREVSLDGVFFSYGIFIYK